MRPNPAGMNARFRVPRILSTPEALLALTSAKKPPEFGVCLPTKIRADTSFFAFSQIQFHLTQLIDADLNARY